jgi:hypothetical protein
MSARTLNSDAVQITIDTLLESKKLDIDADAARIAIAITLAGAVDADPGNASLLREYRAAEAMLNEVRQGASNGAAEVVRAMRAPLGDQTHTRAPHTRTASSRGG